MPIKEKINKYRTDIEKYDKNILKAESNIKMWKTKRQEAEEKVKKLRDAAFIEIIRKSGISLERFEEVMNLETSVSADTAKTTEQNDLSVEDAYSVSAESEDAIFSQSIFKENKDWE